jgi:hypothetical protein
MTRAELYKTVIAAARVAVEAGQRAERVIQFLEMSPQEQALGTVLERLGPEPFGGYTARQVGRAVGRGVLWAKRHAADFPGAGPTDRNNGEWRFPLAAVEHYLTQAKAREAERRTRRAIPRQPLKQYLAPFYAKAEALPPGRGQ